MNKIIAVLFVIFPALVAGQVSSGLSSPNSVVLVTNEGTTGTTLNKLVKLTGAPSTAVVSATTDTSGVIGVVVSGAGTSGIASIQVNGIVSVVFDGATTAGDYAQISSTVAGDAHDTGSSTCPASGQVIGRVMSTNGSSGTYQVNYGSNGCGTGTGSSTVNVNGSPVSNPNFNGTTPAAGSNGKNVALQVSGSNVSAEVVGDGVSTHYLDGTGAYSTPAGGGSGYTNVTQSGTITTAAGINSCGGSGTCYITTPQSIATGGSVTVPVQFSKAGLLTIASGQTLTFTKAITQTDAPSQIFTGSGTVAFTGATQTHAPVEWWGAVPYQTVALAAAGTDSTTFVQACLTAHPVQCDVLYGLYRVTSALSITHDNVGIHGPVMQFIDTSGGGGLISTSASADIIDVAGTNSGSPIYNNIFDHFTLYRSVAATGTAKNFSASYTRSLNINWVFSADGINDYYLLNAQDSRIENSWAYWAQSYSSGTLIGFNIDAATNPQSTYMTHNTVLAGAQGGTVSFVGLNETGASMNDLWSDQLEVSNANYGIVLDGTSVTVPISGFDIHFTNSILDGLWNSCVKVTNMPAVGNSTVQFSGGECSLQSQAASGTSTGFDSETNTGIVEVSHMQFSQGSHAGFQGWMAAIYAKNSSNFIATDNSIIPVNGFYGIEGDGLTTSTIGNNSIKLLGGISGAKGLYLTGTSTGNTLLGNSITGASGTVGLQFDASATGNIALNTYASVTTTVTDTPGTNRWCDSTACHNFTSLATLPAQAADTTVGNYTGSSAAPTANVMPTCTTGARSLQHFDSCMVLRFGGRVRGNDEHHRHSHDLRCMCFVGVCLRSQHAGDFDHALKYPQRLQQTAYRCGRAILGRC
jgi:hypothetical protein